jgi:Mg-chelatase subunit ChlD
MVDTPVLSEMNVAEQRYRAVLAVISDGRTVTEVQPRSGSRQTMHAAAAPGVETLGARGAERVVDDPLGRRHESVFAR